MATTKALIIHPVNKLIETINLRGWSHLNEILQCVCPAYEEIGGMQGIHYQDTLMVDLDRMYKENVSFTIGGKIIYGRAVLIGNSIRDLLSDAKTTPDELKDVVSFSHQKEIKRV